MKLFWTTIAALILSTNIATATDNDETATFNVEKMTCATCPISVRKAMERVDGVKEVSVDFEDKTATVIFDATATTTAEIGKASTNVGFPASLKDGEGA